ncbi:hypothetical protein [Loktanella sp. Alg231-35]|uniref:hypothetical protein n=1 Tax=Loktanella sp. Alg231-35 TaxID=1922220 RepID=UPI000D55DD9C|nr:hypothetical protein [Loktanella sp. Alg231-35]
MSYTVLRKIMHVSAIALIVTTAGGAGVMLTADAAYAERGGNGNGNGNGNGGGNGGGNGNGRNNDRDSAGSSNGNGRDNAGNANRNRNNGNGNGRGAIASELRGLNAAHANQRAMENASPNSMPGRLYAYQVEQQDIEAGIEGAEADERIAQAEYDRLIGLSEDEIAAEFPDGGYEDALTVAANDLLTAQGNTDAAQERENESLMVLTGGRTLSEDALAELNRLLGL